MHPKWLGFTGNNTCTNNWIQREFAKRPTAFVVVSCRHFATVQSSAEFSSYKDHHQSRILCDSTCIDNLCLCTCPSLTTCPTSSAVLFCPVQCVPSHLSPSLSVCLSVCLSLVAAICSECRLYDIVESTNLIGRLFTGLEYGLTTSRHYRVGYGA